MNELKYVIVIPPGFNLLFGARAIIFNGLITHSDVVPKEEGWKVHSAGFLDIDLDSDIIICTKGSESLGVESDPIMDEIIIRRTLTKSHPRMGYLEM